MQGFSIGASRMQNFPCTGITNYPIGVGINGAGEITIADNHNNFNLSVFSQDGQLISALESKVINAPRRGQDYVQINSHTHNHRLCVCAHVSVCVCVCVFGLWKIACEQGSLPP